MCSSDLVSVGFTHQARVKDYGWKVLVDAGSAGLSYDGDPTAAFAVIDVDATANTIVAEIYRASYDNDAVSEQLIARGLPGDAYRAATVRTGKLVR